MTEEKKSNRQLMPKRMKAGEFARTIWVVTVEQGTTKEEMINPAFWAHVANQIRPWDHLEIRSDDGAFYAEYLVMACGRAWVNIHELKFENLTNSDVDQTKASMNEGFTVKYRGPHLKFCVIREQDQECIKEGCTKKEANDWLVGHLETIKV